MKICTKCKQEKELSEFNFRDKNKYIYKKICKECSKKTALLYMSTQDAIEKRQKYLSDDKIKEKRKAYKQTPENKAKMVIYSKEWYKKNKDSSYIKKKIYNSTKQGKEKKSIRSKRYYLTINGKAKKSASDVRRRALKILTVINNSEHENYLIECVYAFRNFKNKITGIVHHVDHIVALVNGGKHHPSNLQILTATENLKKGARI